MELFDDAARDHFFAELYELSTAPFFTSASTQRDVKCFLSLAQPAKGSSVLDLGCGWGRHLALLRQGGYRPIGIERSSSLAQKAQLAVPGTVLRADLRWLPLLTESIDSAACFYSSLFLFDEKENERALGEVARVLKRGGPLFLETANPIYLRRLGPQTQTLSVANGSQVFESAEFDLATGRENGFRRLTRPDGSTLEGRYSVRHYAPGELEALARRVGLKVERVCGDHDLGPFTRQSRDLIVLLRKLGS